jgi:putative DNA primase/helicase
MWRVWVGMVGCKEFKVILFSFIRPLLKSTIKLLDEIWNEMQFREKSQLGNPEFDSHYLVFENGTLNLEIREFLDHTPEVFTTYKMMYEYDKDAKSIPVFLKFLDDLCCGKEDRKKYLRSILYTIVLSTLEFQVIVYIFGPGARGKSQLTTLLIPLLGEYSVISTTLLALESDHFEVVNLIGKKFILVNDTSGIIKDTHIIKAYSGHDLLRGRSMHRQGTVEVPPEGIIVTVGNDPLNIIDSGNAIGKRLRAFETTKVSDSRRPVILKRYDTWIGPLSQELSGIFNWIIDQDFMDVENYMVKTKQFVPSFKDSFQHSLSNGNCFLRNLQ